MNPYLVNRKRGESYIGISIEYRMYPTKEQERFLYGLGNKLRGAYNLLVATYVKGKDYKDIIRKNKDTQKELYDLLVNTEWLENVPAMFITAIIQQFFTSLDNFRRNKKRPPNFKKKNMLLTISSNHAAIQTIKFNWDENNIIFLPVLLKKNGTSSNFKIQFHKKFEGGTLKNLSINRKSDGNWYISLSFDVTGVMELPSQVTSEKSVGIDVGIKDMAITSDGSKYQVAIKEIQSLENKINKINKEISRKQRINKGNFRSRNYNDLLKRKGRLQQRVNNLRKNTHRYATTVLTKGKYGTIQLEDIKLGFMLKNKNLSKATQRIGINSFTTNLKAVSNSKGIKVNFVNPKNTSKTCSECGHIYKELKLKERSWTCVCGTKHDRDINAAKNIKKSLDITK